jgi:ubiquinone/menaquinone biosynthesis C-methylase UbiE
MSLNQSSETEVSRIRAAYFRRNQAVPKDRYSIFKDENLIARQQLERQIIRLLTRHGHAQLEQKKILDVGCGAGFWLRQFVQWGAKPENLFGIDLLEDRIQEGKGLCPPCMTLQLGDAGNLEFEDSAFDLVMQFTVFTSILDPEMKKKLATEISRVLKPGGALLWYDYFVSNPFNPDVLGVTRKEISQLFPVFSISLRRITLAPPLARAVGTISPALCRVMSVFKPLCTHYLGFFKKS